MNGTSQYHHYPHSGSEWHLPSLFMLSQCIRYIMATMSSGGRFHSNPDWDPSFWIRMTLAFTVYVGPMPSLYGHHETTVAGFTLTQIGTPLSGSEWHLPSLFMVSQHTLNSGGRYHPDPDLEAPWLRPKWQKSSVNAVKDSEWISGDQQRETLTSKSYLLQVKRRITTNIWESLVQRRMYLNFSFFPLQFEQNYSFTLTWQIFITIWKMWSLAIFCHNIKVIWNIYKLNKISK